MNLDLSREIVTDLSAAGRLLVNGVFECYTLEDTIREIPNVPVSEWKKWGKTAIPHGKYKVIITPSARFGRNMPLLVDVEGFTGIRIHSGNTAADTEGCILVGTYREGADIVRGSKAAFDSLYWKIKSALSGGENVEIAISNPA